MKRLIAGVASAAVVLGGLVGFAPTVSAATSWDYASGRPFTLSDGQGSTATVTISNVRVTGGSMSGRVGLANGRYACSTQAFSDLTAQFSLGGQYDPCSGTITFSVDSAGVLSVSDSSVYIPSTLLTGPGTGSAQGTEWKLACSAALNGSAGADVTWTDPVTGATGYTVTALPADAQASASSGTTSATVTGLKPGTAYAFTVTASANGAGPPPCTTAKPIWTPPAAPQVDGTPVTVPVGGLMTVNYSLPDPTGVQGIEYQIDGGPWLRPGGVAPVGGKGGSFTVSGLTSKDLSLTLRSVGDDAGGPLWTATATVTSVSFAKTPLPKPPSLASAAGSTSTAPVPAPAAAPVSAVSGSSNGSGTGTNGALAASTGDAGIDAPCLAQDGTLYPTQYSTVGSQLTMAPNTRGLGKASAFTVVAGALPPGMQLDRTFGVLFGVTTQTGSWVTTIKAKFADGSTKTSRFTTRVDADPQTLQYAAQNVGSVGTGIAIAPTTNAPVTGTTYELVCGTLPSGTKFDTRTGLITGKPTAVVAMPTPLRVAETSTTGKAAASFIFVVNRAGTTSISYPAHPHVRVGKRVAIRPTVAGVGDIAVFRMWKGKLPKGLRLNKVTGVVTGRIAHRGPTHTITIVAVTKGGALLTAAPMRLRLQR
jgi:hypothetical protein